MTPKPRISKRPAIDPKEAEQFSKKSAKQAQAQSNGSDPAKEVSAAPKIKYVPYSIKIDQELLDRTRRTAVELGLTASAFVVMSLNAAIKKHESEK